MRKVIVSVLILLLLTVSIIREQHAVQSNGTANNPKSDTDLPKEITGKDGAPMVLIPAGEFQMGTDPSEIPELVQWANKWYSQPQTNWFEDETPRHTIYVDAFYMDVYEVTNAQYKKFMYATGYKKLVTPRRYWNSIDYNADYTPNEPVVGVSWYDAVAYCEWAGKRLPTEAEWEKAARGGLVGKRFPWGDTDPNGTQCNFASKNIGYSWWSNRIFDDGYEYVASVGKYSPNGYGLYDMAGNVWEWCADWCGNYYANSPKQNPKGPNSGSIVPQRVLRGGCWNDYPLNLRVSNRHGNSYFGDTFYPDPRSQVVGFRCVQDIPK